MQLIDGRPVFSATDLVGFLECEHLTTLDRAVLHGMVTKPVREDAELAILQRRGIEHEQRYLAHLVDEGLHVAEGQHPNGRAAELDRGAHLRANAELTLQRMRVGADVIYQATFFDGRWLGYADFLRRVDGASDLGGHHYEVADTKLARRTKGSALLQMCVYSDLLAQLQGRLPEHMYVALGGSARTVDRHRLNDYLAYYRRVKDRFEAVALTGQPPIYPLPAAPDPVSHCAVCRWQEHCAGLRSAADHLSLVAFLRGDQARKLDTVGIRTGTALATLEPPMPDIERMSDATLEGLRSQAALQLRSRGLKAPLYELLPAEHNKGLGTLPEPSWGDLFFDMEGDPWAEEDGLEYLFGVIDGDEFHDWWAHTRAEEKVAFERFIDFVMDRWRADPAMHVYHYASYERGRMGMLSTRHATREEEVDKLLTAGVFVDLYKVVRQGVRIGSPSYSIKRLEPLYALEREVPLQDAGSSVVAYESYILSVSAGRPEQQILDEIRAYNRDDCLSNRDLRAWLEERRAELGGVERPSPSDETAESPASERDARIEVLAARLMHGTPAEGRTPEQQGRWLLANLLEWHRREEKVEWWEFFDRCSRSDEELVEDAESIGQLTWIAEVERPRRSIVNRYGFDPEQPYRLKEGDTPVNPRTEASTGTIVALDPLHGTLDLMWQAPRELQHPTSLIPKRPFTADEQKAALERIGAWVAEHGLDGPGPYRSARCLLLGEPPRAGQEPGASLARPDEKPTEAACRLARSLDATVLPVQGPPGSGKTYAGAEMILALIREGRRMGITAFTHKAIINLLDEVMEHAAKAGTPVAAIRKLEQNEDPGERPYRCSRSNDEVADALAGGEVQLAAGTAWMWARPEFEAGIDTLFVDEAGQMSLANVIAVSGAARNVVLLGDPQQLSQVKKGAHPEGVDVSSLEHVLAGAPVIDPTRGLFLAETWRLHPDVNAFTSELFYESKLRSEASAAGQSLEAPGRFSGTGVRWLPVEHHGNANASEEEAAAVLEVYRDLLGGTWTDAAGMTRPIRPRDILVITPYNAQVELLDETLRPIAGDGLRVGTVDKIQGQQAAVAIYSMATSSQEEMPRTMEFLFSLNRLNVATSRGRCLAIIVASHRLLEVSVHTPFQMRLANALCRFVELAESS
ncbi:MAG: TM0106 family RecB-like putative nuclease [Candidatus Limnocylindria bacterium]